MANRKTEIKLIENASARQVTFSKRKERLLKKAHDLAIRCDAELGVIIFSSEGKLFQFASSSMQSVLERFAKACMVANLAGNRIPQEGSGVEHLSHLTQQSEAMPRAAIGNDLERLSLRDLTQLEKKVHASLTCIRARKEELLVDQLGKMKRKVAEAQNEAEANSRFVLNLVNPHGSVRANSEESECCERSSNVGYPEWLPQGEASMTRDYIPDCPSVRTECPNESPACLEQDRNKAYHVLDETDELV